jgi:hypothetical protein
MKSRRLFMCAFSVAFLALAQTDRGTITGTVSDPAGAVVANAAVQIRNVETGAIYPAGASATGNYTLAQLPAGQYELSVTVPDFKNFVRKYGPHRGLPHRRFLENADEPEPRHRPARPADYGKHDIRSGERLRRRRPHLSQSVYQ